jgi:hypothetical protein
LNRKRGDGEKENDVWAYGREGGKKERVQRRDAEEEESGDRGQGTACKIKTRAQEGTKKKNKSHRAPEPQRNREHAKQQYATAKHEGTKGRKRKTRATEPQSLSKTGNRRQQFN